MTTKVGGSGYAILKKELITRHKIVDIPLVKASAKSLYRYGAILYSKEEALSEFRNQTWPKMDGWRQISNGTGNEALPAIGTFNHYWKKYQHQHQDVDDFYICCAQNEAVSRSYETAMCDLKNRCIYVREMNYHPCGNQLLYPINANSSPFIVLLGRQKQDKHHDDIGLDDIKAFYFEGDVGLNIFAGTWHQPSFPYNINIAGNIKLYNVQSSVHACVVYDSIDEHDTLMRISIPDNMKNIQYCVLDER